MLTKWLHFVMGERVPDPKRRPAAPAARGVQPSRDDPHRGRFSPAEPSVWLCF